MATKLILLFVYIYCRISEDKQGRAEGVQAQEKWGREYAAEHWPGVPVIVFADNDLSAAKDDVVRPEFDRMREGIRRGECAHLWAVEQTRLTRREPEWFSLVADLSRAGVSEVHTKRNGIIDVEGVVGAIMAVLGAYEVKQLRKRVIDTLGERAAEGRPHGHTGFAYRQRVRSAEHQERLEQWWRDRNEARDRGEDMRLWKDAHPRPPSGMPVVDDAGRAAAELVPERADLVRWAAARILDGWTVTAVAREFDRQGVTGVYGGRIWTSGIRTMLTRPAIAGFRVYRGEIVGKATWEPVLDEATWRAVRGRLNGHPAEPGHEQRRAARSYLLTRFAVCASCGQPMGGVWLKHGGQSVYRCTVREVHGNCGRMRIQAGPADRHVIGELFSHLAGQDIAGPDDEHAADRDRIIIELQAIDGQRAEWMTARDAGQLNLGEFLAAKAKFDAGQQQLERDLAGLPAPVRKLDPEQLREAWPEMTLDEQRQVLGDWIEKVIIHPPAPRVTMRDVAAKAGISLVTVQRVISGGDPVSETLASQVRAAVEETGYERMNGSRGVRFDAGRIEILWQR